MAFKFRVSSGGKSKIPLPSFPDAQGQTDAENLTGMVQGKQASAPEERLAQALDRGGFEYQFRMVIGAPKGLPGWKELDFLISTDGMLQAVEVDTAFTHRNKHTADILHDALVLNDKELNSYGTLFPRVLHADGDSELANIDNAVSYVKRNFVRTPWLAPTYPQTRVARSVNSVVSAPQPMKKVIDKPIKVKKTVKNVTSNVVTAVKKYNDRRRY